MKRMSTRWSSQQQHGRPASWRWVLLVAAITISPAAAYAEPHGSGCFDVSGDFAETLVQPVEPRETGDHAVYGKRRDDGTSWAATRAIIELPPEIVLAKLKDHRNFKDMSKTTLSSQRLESSAYFDLRHVQIDVRIKKAFLKFHLRWTEEWAYRLVGGTPDLPSVVVANYQKVAGTHHIERQCGSYVVRRLAADRTDLSLYDEIRAKRRSAEDTSKMHKSILRNIREDRWPTEAVVAERRVARARSLHLQQRSPDR